MTMRAEISVCEPDFKVRTDEPSAKPNDPLYNQQWNMQAIKVPTVWAGGQYGDPQRRVSRPAGPVCLKCLILSAF